MKKEEFADCILYCGDCLEIMPEIKDKSIDLILTDPPYFGISKNTWDNQWATIQDFQNWVDILGGEFNKKLKDNGSFFWFGDDKNIAYVQIVLDKHFRLLNSLVWRKEYYYTMKGATSVFRSFSPITERCLFYEKGEIMPNPFAQYLKEELLRAFGTTANLRHFVVNNLQLDSAMINRWFEGSCIISKEKYLAFRKFLNGDYLRRDYQDLRRECEDFRRTWNNNPKSFDVLDFRPCIKNRMHPTQKPLDLIMYLAERTTKENNIIFDPFMGSGTTGVACVRSGRKFIGIELDEKYFESDCRRIEAETKQLKFDFKERL